MIAAVIVLAALSLLVFTDESEAADDDCGVQ